MCLLLFAYKVDPQYPLLLVGNRDEFYERPTAPLNFWTDHPHVLAGRDLLKKGTWMGITRNGKFAALTNYRDPNHPSNDNELSRGYIVSDFLTKDIDPTTYLHELKNTHHLYPGYNLLFGNHSTLYYYSNISNESQVLEPGVYGLSNHLLDTNWPKVRKGKAMLSERICLEKFDKESLFQIVRDDVLAPDHELPETGVGLEWERKLSPLFIQTANYGTRSSSLLKLTSDKQIKYTERTYLKDNQYEDRTFEVAISK